MHQKLIVLLVLTVFLFQDLTASGFSIYEQGTRATGMAGAFIARANDASAIFYNPAGLTHVKGLQFSAGTTVINTQFAFTGPSELDPQYYTPAEEGTFYPVHAYGAYRISEKFSAGLGLYSMFGLSSTWGSKDNPWVGRQLATNTELQTLFINPVAAYRAFDFLSISAGFSYVQGSVKLEKSVLFIPRLIFGESALEASAAGYGFNLALQLKPFSFMELGAVYRSNVTMDFKEGDARFIFPDTGDDVINQEIATYFPSKTKGSAKLTLPEMTGLGLAVNFTDNLSAEFDYVKFGWSSYDKLKVSFRDSVAGKTMTESPKNYEDSYSLRFGLEYQVDCNLSLRAGYIWDRHAVPEKYVEPTLPEGNRHNYTLGVGYQWRGFRIDASYQALIQDDRRVENSVHDFNGKYTGLANLYGLTFGYTF